MAELLQLHELSPAWSDGSDLAAPLLFAHPVSFHGRVWGPVARQLSHPGRQVALDLPGHGSVPLTEGQPVDWYSLSELVWSTVEAAGLVGSVGVGHSMGAALLTMVEVHHRGTFGALWLYEPVIPSSTSLPPELQGTGSGPRRKRRVTFGSIDEAYGSYRGKVAMERVDDEALRAYVEHGFDVAEDGTATLRCPPDVSGALASGWQDNRIYDRVGELDCPVHLVHGDRSGYQARWTQDLHTALPGSTLEEYPDLLHLGPLEQPARIASSIDAFLSHTFAT